MLRAHRKQWIQRRVVDVMPGDAYVKCHCPECSKAYTKDENYASNLVWGFAAEIAERLRKDGFSDVVVAQSAYYPYQTIPDIDLPSNVEVGVCVTGPYDKYNPVKLKRDNELIRAWTKKVGKKVMLSNYGYKRRQPGIPNLTPRAYAEYFTSLRDCIGGEFLFYDDTDRFMYTTLQDYVFAKIAWDNNVDVEAIFSEYYANLFGKAAPVMRTLMEEFEDIWLQKIGGRTIETDIGPMSSFPSDTEIWTNIYDSKTIGRLTAEFDKAEAMVNGICKERIQLFRKEFLEPLKNGYRAWSAVSSLPEGLVAYQDMPIVLAPFRRGKAAALKTEVSYSLAETDLSFVFQCQEPRPEARSMAERAKDDNLIWQDDSIEIFLNPSGDRKSAYHIIVNSKGNVSDAKVNYLGRNGVHDWNYETGAKVQVTEAAGCFSVKVTIPLSSLPDLNKEGFPANFCRSRIVREEENSLYCWSPIALNFGDIEHFGVIRFSDSMIKNGSFTAPLRRSGWSERLPEGIARDEQVYFSAPASLCIASKGKSESISQLLPKLTQGRKYRLSCLIKTENVVPGGSVSGACLKLQGAPGRQVWMPRPSLQGTNDWCRYTCDFVADEKISDNVRMNLWIYNGTGKVWFDDLSLQELE